MKNYLLLVLFSLTANVAFSNELKGEEHLSQWGGTYKVTNCISCPDINFGDKKTLNDITEFYIESHIVPNNELPSCATTNKDIYFDYVFVEESGTTWTNFFSHGTLCYFKRRPGITQGISVVMTDKEFVYSRNTSKDKSHRFTGVKHLTGNKYEITQKVIQYHSRNRPLERFEFKLEAQKQ